MCQRTFMAVLSVGLAVASMAGCSGDDSNASDAAGGAAGGSSVVAGGGASGAGGATGIAGQPPAGAGGVAGSGGSSALGGSSGSTATPPTGGSTAAGGSGGSGGTTGVVGGSTGESLLPAAPTGGGYCCPIGMPSCNGFQYGGWVAVDDPKQCPRVVDMAPPGTVGLDSHGCSYLYSTASCLDWVRDAGDAASDVKDSASEGDVRTFE